MATDWRPDASPRYWRKRCPGKPLRILLIAYEYPPVVAAQSLRWFYLSNELAGLGVEIQVLCPSFTALPAFPVPLHAGIVEHRVWPGPFIGLTQWLARRRGDAQETAPSLLRHADRSLAFRLYRAIRQWLDRVLYPDVRSEWYPFARRRLKQLLAGNAYDAIISSHEPGVDLLLGLWAKKRHGINWIVDLADPLCAPYTPAWRRWLDTWVEALVIRRADRVVVTTEPLIDLLKTRHGLADGDKFACLPQAAPALAATGSPPPLSPGKMSLVFTGNFYEQFRSPGAFAAALKELSCADITFTVAGDNDRFLPLFAGVDNVRFLGRLGHFACLDLQRRADVLLNIGNAQPYQMPGKLYEYLGAGKPILHLSLTADDPGAALLRGIGAGIVVDNDPPAIARALRQLLAAWRQDVSTMPGSPDAARLAPHTWRARAEQWLALIADSRR